MQIVHCTSMTSSTIVAATTTDMTASSGGGVRPIQAILGKNSTAAATSVLPITSTMANPGISLTGSTAMGFTIGLFKG